jgi:hypothetical protein
MIDDVVTLESTTPLLFSPLVFRDLYDGNASCVCLIGLFQSTSGAVLVCPRVMSSLSIKGEREKVSIGLSVHFYLGFRRPSRSSR